MCSQGVKHTAGSRASLALAVQISLRWWAAEQDAVPSGREAAALIPRGAVSRPVSGLSRGGSTRAGREDALLSACSLPSRIPVVAGHYCCCVGAGCRSWHALFFLCCVVCVRLWITRGAVFTAPFLSTRLYFVVLVLQCVWCECMKTWVGVLDFGQGAAAASDLAYGIRCVTCASWIRAGGVVTRGRSIVGFAW